jgi:hypothetical protein
MLMHAEGLSPEVIDSQIRIAKAGTHEQKMNLVRSGNVLHDVQMVLVKDQDVAVREALAATTHSPLVQSVLCMDDAESVLLSLARNENISNEVQMQMLLSNNQYVAVREAIASTTRVPLLQAVLCRDVAESVLVSLARNVNIIDEAVVALTMVEPLGRYVKVHHALSNNPSLNTGSLVRIIHSVATSKTRTPLIQAVLCRDDAESVLLNYARNENITDEAVVALTTVEPFGLYMKVHHALSNNPSLDTGSLVRIIHGVTSAENLKALDDEGPTAESPSL